jgi:hypothetical protein
MNLNCLGLLHWRSTKCESHAVDPITPNIPTRTNPTHAGWKHYGDSLMDKVQEFGAVDLDHVDIPYDRYIVEDWPDNCRAVCQ